MIKKITVCLIMTLLVSYGSIFEVVRADGENCDVNSDGIVDILDLNMIEQHLGESGSTGWIPEDVNQDGEINVLDIIVTGQSIGATSMGVYSVAPNGSDSNPGTETQPWQTIQKAANTLVAGETVYIKEGTYREQVIPQNSGDPDNHIVYSAYPGDTVVIDGDGISTSEAGGWLHGLFVVYGKNHINVTGLRVINVGLTDSTDGAGIVVNKSSDIIVANNFTSNTFSSGIVVWSSSDITVDGNEVELACNGGKNESITIAGTDRFEVKNNHVHDNASGPYGGEGIDVKHGSSNGVVSNNTVHDCVQGIYVDAWDSHTYNIEIFGNVVYENDGFGIGVASEMGGLLENVKIYNNLSYRNTGFGFVTGDWGLAETMPVRDIIVTNNTFYANGDSWGGGIILKNPEAENVVIRNNICSQNLSFQIEVDSEVPAGTYTIDSNLIEGFSGYSFEVDGENYIEGDPLFINPSVFNFRLQEGSPAIDNGSSINAPDIDFDGNTRPLGVSYDIGAFESAL